MERVIVYIDGFNLYFGLSDKGWRRYLWLDLPQLSRSLLGPHQDLVATKYFTTPVRADAAKVRRQSTYLQALLVRRGVSIRYGRYQAKPRECRNCGATWTEYEEKMSDVRLAAELLRDTFADLYDTAIIVSADADLQPPIEIVRQDYPAKHIVIVFPPARDSFYLRQIAHAHFRIGRRILSKCQLPPTVTKPDGFVLRRPPEWS